MKDLQKLFDIQKIDPNEKLAAIINDTNSRYSGTTVLDEDELDLVAGGQSLESDVNFQANADADSQNANIGVNFQERLGKGISIGTINEIHREINVGK